MTTSRNDTESAPQSSCCKVGRTIESYGLSRMDDELADRWTGRRGEKYSLRKLEKYFNVAVLEAALREANVDPLEGEAENLYDLLKSDDVSEIEARRRLEREGLDVDGVTGDFVSHQAIHGHLRECLGVELERDSSDRIEKGQNTVASLQNRLVAVTENTLDRLDQADAISLGDFSVFVSVQVTCEECGRPYSVSELLEQKGCECQKEE